MELTRRSFGRYAVGVAAAGALGRTALGRTALGRTAWGRETAEGQSAAQGAASGGGRPVGYAVVGLGRISVDEFLPGLRGSTKARATALVSGSPDKARKIAAQYGVPETAIYSYEQYDRLRDNPAVDAVYIGLPNGMHAEYTIRAAKAGKHVLCEKPMANTVEESQAMIAACREAKRKLMIAYRCHLEPTTLHARELVRSGALGKISAIESANGFNIKAGEWRLNRKLAGGGPLMDVGIYSLNACRFLLGEEPEHMAASTSVVDHDGRFDEVEETAAWTMKFPSGVVAACTTTYGADMDGFYRVHGSKGSFTVQPGFAYEGIHLTGKADGKALDDLEREKNPAQFQREAEYFADCVTRDREPEPNGEEGLKDMQHMMRIYELAGHAAGATKQA